MKTKPIGDTYVKRFVSQRERDLINMEKELILLELVDNYDYFGALLTCMVLHDIWWGNH